MRPKALSPARRRLSALVRGSARGALAAELVREFLVWGGCGHTAEVLAAEAPMLTESHEVRHGRYNRACSLMQSRCVT